jgi:hypothetical protein
MNAVFAVVTALPVRIVLVYLMVVLQMKVVAVVSLDRLAVIMPVVLI